MAGFWAGFTSFLFCSIPLRKKEKKQKKKV
jgi:hypothetical protein